MKAVRASRINSEVQKNISEIIRDKLKGVSLNGLMVSVIKADTSADLKHAKIYLSVYSKDEEKNMAAFQQISDSAGFIRRELASMMSTKTVPELHFFLDDSLDYGEKIDRILKDI